MESRGSSKHSRRRSIDTAGSVRFVAREEAVRLMVWDWCTGNEQELDAIERIQKNWRKGRRMKLLQRHPYKKHVTPDGTFFYSKRDDPSQVTWCAPHVPDRHGLPIAFRDEAAMKALAAANAEYQKNRAKEKAKRQVFIDIIKERHAVGKRRRDEEAARAARALFDKRWGDAFEFARRGAIHLFFNLRRLGVCVVIPWFPTGRGYQRDVVSEFGPKPGLWCRDSTG